MNSYPQAPPEPLAATLSEKGQITIPKPLRESLGLRTGTVVLFLEEHGHLVIRKQVDENPFEAVRGSVKLPEGMTVDAWMDELRGEADLP
jgi:antitoxin PrlF